MLNYHQNSDPGRKVQHKASNISERQQHKNPSNGGHVTSRIQSDKGLLATAVAHPKRQHQKIPRANVANQRLPAKDFKKPTYQ